MSIWWDYHHHRNPYAMPGSQHQEQFATSRPLARTEQYRTFMGAMVSGYITLQAPRHLLGYGDTGIFDTYLKPALWPALAGLHVPATLGFAAEGRLII